MAKRILPTPEQLRELLRYEPETGKLFWRERPVSMFPPGNTSSEANCRAWNRRWANKETFVRKNKGYLLAEVLHQPLSAHRVAWAITHGEWPPEEIDHINMDRADNRISNLRLASTSENRRNTRGKIGSISRMKGAHWHGIRGRWRSRIDVDGKSKFLGYFDTPEEAHAAYQAAAKKYHGEFARFE